MPQFDQFSFFNQVFFFLFFFFNFYFFITYYFLPKICFNIKFRKKKLNFDNKKKNQIDFEKKNIFFFFNNSYKLFFLNFETFLNKKVTIYQNNQKNKIQQITLINTIFKEKINFFLNKKFLLSKKTFINFFNN